MGNRVPLVSKWSKTQILRRSKALARHLPETRLMNARTLKGMLDRYGLAYVKPVVGSLGRGVIKVEKRGRGYRVHAGTSRVRFDSYAKAYRWILAHKRKRTYLAQRGIRVLRRGGRPVDFRVMIQRRPDRKWEVTGTLARVAHPLKAVTNGSQGGTIYSASGLLRAKVGKRGAKRLVRRFHRLARLTAARLNRVSGLNELGLDVAVDGKLRTWILEVNSRPDAKPFKLLRNRSMLRRIVRLGRLYGRKYDLRVTKAKRG
ncbi:hypothetical protein J19TS2_42330 [Cohnella xylanilytica]|uniref:YheC/YheD family protein n=1 Tax=Cohnella xylanilytica TaxID=557555 RepID=A0A841TTL8_9BACL|nr:YheC/YheD family protein [Cohnella xylanilytica]GIO14678.1 hypothetical protein J19TS2_42330 [Cohnella xylanilytica]